MFILGKNIFDRKQGTLYTFIHRFTIIKCSYDRVHISTCVASTDHKLYLTAFLRDFEHVLQGMIDRGIQTRQQTAITDPLSLECIEHIQFAQSKAKLFRGRQQFLENILKKLAKDKSDHV